MAWRRIDVHRAAERGDVAVLERYLKAGGDPVRKDSAYGAAPVHWACLGKATALHHAATYGHAEAVTILLTRGADARVKDVRGEKPGDKFDDEVVDNVRRAISKILAKAVGENRSRGRRRSLRRTAESGKGDRRKSAAASTERSRQQHGERGRSTTARAIRDNVNRQKKWNGQNHPSRSDGFGEEHEAGLGKDNSNCVSAIENPNGRSARTVSISPPPPTAAVVADGSVTVQQQSGPKSGKTPLNFVEGEDTVVVNAAAAAGKPLTTKNRNFPSSRGLPKLPASADVAGMVGSTASHHGTASAVVELEGNRRRNSGDKNTAIAADAKQVGATPIGWSVAALAKRFLNGSSTNQKNIAAADSLSNSDSGYCSPQLDIRDNNGVMAVTFAASSEDGRSSPDAKYYSTHDNNDNSKATTYGDLKNLRKQLVELSSAADAAAASDLEGRAAVRDVVEDFAARAREAALAERAKSEKLGLLVQALEARLAERDSRVARLEAELEGRDGRLREGKHEILALRKRVHELDNSMSVLRNCLDRLPPSIRPDVHTAHREIGDNSPQPRSRTKSSPSLSMPNGLDNDDTLRIREEGADSRVEGGISAALNVTKHNFRRTEFVDVGRGTSTMGREGASSPASYNHRRRTLPRPALRTAVGSGSVLEHDPYSDVAAKNGTEASSENSSKEQKSNAAGGVNGRGALDDNGNLSANQIGGESSAHQMGGNTWANQMGGNSLTNQMGGKSSAHQIGRNLSTNQISGSISTREEAVAWWRQGNWIEEHSGHGTLGTNGVRKLSPDPAEDHERLGSLYSMIARR